MHITPPKLKVVEEFKSFLLKHQVVGLAVGVVIGAAVGKVVTALVGDIIMPVVGLLTPSGEWRAVKLGIFGVGDLLGNILDFTIVAFVVFMIIKQFIKEAPPAPSKTCPACKESIHPEATRCKFCTAEVGK
ncbi:MAG: large conductance mechanosensitive channel protein MscL [Pseudomonadota bacterium]